MHSTSELTNGLNWSLRGLVGATLAAFGFGTLLAFTLVLPAEVGYDPLGTGAWLGIARASQISTSSHIEHGELPMRDEVSFVLDPFQSVEYKYRMEKGDVLVYRWIAEDEVLFDFHGEAEGTDPEDSVTYHSGRQQAVSGQFLAPAKGVHGWYWQNRTMQPQVVRLKASGFASASITYSNKGAYERKLDVGTN